MEVLFQQIGIYVVRMAAVRSGFEFADGNGAQAFLRS